MGNYIGRVLPIYRKEFFEPKYDIRDPHNSWFANGCPVSTDRLTDAWQKRLKEYVEPELDEERRTILRRLLPVEYHGII